MRVSAGFHIEEYFGTFGKRENPEVEMAAIDADKCFGVVIKNEDRIKDTDMIYA